MPAARLLDLTRLVSRAALVARTGVDRTEAAYLDRLIADPVPLFALVRTTLGFVLLDRSGATSLRDRLRGTMDWGPPDLLGRLSQRHDAARARAEAELRRLALARALPAGLGALLRRHLPAGTAYLNTGHSNLSARVFDALRTLPGTRISVLVHDTIPLEHPQFASPGTPLSFAARLRRAGAAADLVIYNSHQSRADAERHFAGWGRVPEGCVAPLGVDRFAPDPTALPPDLDLDLDLKRPYFLALGTIEPRKNIPLLLDIWQEMAAEARPETLPQLLLVGRRGWADPGLLARLDALPPGGPVRELGALSDTAVAALLHGAAALLFPSFAEGYGLPPLEAAAAGTPVLCNDLPIYRETLGNYPVYARVSDRYLWAKEIKDLATRAGQGAENRAENIAERQRSAPRVPSWEDHFKPVLRLT